MNKPFAPMVRAAFRESFLLAMQRSGIDSDFYFRKFNIPLSRLDNPDILIPEKPFWALVNFVSIAESVPDFGYRVARLTPFHKIESITPLISESQNLEELLRKFCSIASSQSSPAELKLRDTSQGYWFSRTGPTLFPNDIQMELYRITGMIQLVQLAAGSGWRPASVELFMPPTNTEEKCKIISQSRIYFNSSNSGICIPKILFKLPVRISFPSTSRIKSNYDQKLDFVGTLKQVLDVYSKYGQCNVGEIASIFDMSVRTLQRRLSSQGLSFRKLFNASLHAHAIEQLKLRSKSIDKIAQELGYNNKTNFVRAFKQWSGMTPGEYRKSVHNKV